MQKLIQFSQYFADTFEPTLQVLDDHWFEQQTLEKTASEAFDYIKSVKAQKGKTYILVIAMGAGEYWGANKNGDYFPEADLLRQYKNFETKFDKEGKINGGALIFKHHRNKLIKGHPWYGIVKRSFYNKRMHRVELLLEIDNAKAPDIVQKINDGYDLAVSMGVRIPHDQCSECGNKAPTRKQYCKHLKYLLGKTLPNGRKVYAINGNYDYTKHKNPLNFFDISVVFRPADQTGWMLKKVALDEKGETAIMGSAELAEKEAAIREKIAILNKLSEIDKLIKGEAVAIKKEDGDLKVLKSYMANMDKAVSKMKPLSKEKITKLAQYPLNQVISTLNTSNIVLSTPEFASLVMTKLGYDLGPENLQDLAAHQSDNFEYLANNTEKLAEILSYKMFLPASENQKVAELIEDIKENRDMSEQGFFKKAGFDWERSVLDLHDPQYPWGDRKGMLYSHTVTDPETGRKYAVNMDAVETAKMYSTMTDLGKLLGGAALLGSAYHMLSHSSPAIKVTAPLAGVAALTLGQKGLKDFTETQRGEQFQSDEGLAIPRNAIMIEKTSSLWGKKQVGGLMASTNETLKNALKQRSLGAAAPIAATALLNKYYEDRLKSGIAGSYQSPRERLMDSAGQTAYVHPLLTAAGGVAASQTGMTILDKLRKAMFEGSKAKFRR